MSDEHIIINRFRDVVTYHEEPMMERLSDDRVNYIIAANETAYVDPESLSMAIEIQQRRAAMQAYLDALDAWDTARFSGIDMDRHVAAERQADALDALRDAHRGGP